MPKASKKKPPPRMGTVRTTGARTKNPTTSNPVVERIELDYIYQLEYTRCGSKGCHCMKGSQGHGPYWYAYYVQAGRWASEYIGKNPTGGELDKELRRRKRGKKR